MKVLPPAVLALEAVVVALSVPVALTAGGRGAAAGWALGALALLLLLAAGAARRPVGVAIGSVLQLVVILAGLVLPALAVVGLLFLGVWVTALVFGAKADRAAAANRARAAADGAGPAGAEAPGTDG